MYAGVSQLELDESPRCEGGEDAEEDDEDNARHHADLWSRIHFIHTTMIGLIVSSRERGIITMDESHSLAKFQGFCKG